MPVDRSGTARQHCSQPRSGAPARSSGSDAGTAISPAAVDLYAVGVHWALGDAGAALDAGKNLRPEHFPTAERKARMGTDMARAWWAWQRPEQTTRALLDAYRASPGEVRDRPAIRRIPW